MNRDDKEEFGGELEGLARRLRSADFSGESGVREGLRRRLLAKAERPARRWRLAWLLPAAAAAAAALLMLDVRHRPGPPADSGASGYNLFSDGYGACGRQGLPDYLASGRY